MSCIVNFDEHKSAIQKFTITDDFRTVCRVGIFSFFSKEQLNFEDESNWIRFVDTDWIPIKVQETFDNTQFGYEIKMIPKGSLSKVNRTINNTVDLANQLNVSVSGLNIKMPVNIIGCSALNFCIRARSYSLNMNYNDINKALFLYYDTSTLISNTLGSIFNDDIEEYTNTSGFNEKWTFFDSRNERKHELDVIQPSPLTTTQILNSHIGRTVIIQSTKPANLFKAYSMRFGNRLLPKMVCTKIQMSSELQPQVYVNTFSEIV